MIGLGHWSDSSDTKLMFPYEYAAEITRKGKDQQLIDLLTTYKKQLEYAQDLSAEVITLRRENQRLANENRFLTETIAQQEKPNGNR